jgi:hypothetical protein
MKKILSLAAVALILVGCASTETITPERQAIDRVFAADVNFARNSSSVRQLVLNQKTLSLAGVPTEFANAYKANIAAWEKMEAIEKKMYVVDQAKAARDINVFLNGYAVNSLRAFAAFRAEWPQFSEELDKAFQEIERTRVAFKAIGATHFAVYPTPSSWF